MRILFLTHRLPYAPNRGDRVRAYHLIKEMRRWADVDLVSLVHDADEASHESDLDAVVSTVRVVPVTRVRNAIRSVLALPTERPLTHTMFDAATLRATVRDAVGAHPPSVLFSYCSGMAQVAFDPELRALPFVLDMVDVDSAKWAALSKTTPWPKSWVYRREARTLAAFERAAADHAFVTFVTTERERDTLRAIAPAARIEVVQNGVDRAALVPPGPPSASPVVVFCGVMNYPPNEEAARFLAREVWPIVRRERPDARLDLVGSTPTPAVSALASAESGIVVTGHVPDVRPYLWGAAVAVAPLLIARGIQNKVLEAVAAGLPAVVTPVVMQGLPPEIHAACRVAEGGAAVAAAILALLRLSPDERRAMAERARLELLRWEARLSGLEGIFSDAVRPRRAG